VEEYFFKKPILRGQRVRARHPRKRLQRIWSQISTRATDRNTLVSIGAVIALVLALLEVGHA